MGVVVRLPARLSQELARRNGLLGVVPGCGGIEQAEWVVLSDVYRRGNGAQKLLCKLCADSDGARGRESDNTRRRGRGGEGVLCGGDNGSSSSRQQQQQQ